MIKRLFFVAVLSLPYLADAANPSGTSSVQVVPAGSGPTAPAGAQAAGFTTIALNSDFTQPMPDGWMGNCAHPGDGTPNNPQFYNDDKPHMWWQNIWWSAQYEGCVIGQVTDPVYGGTVLDMPWTVDSRAASVGTIMQSASWDYNGSTGAGAINSFPNNSYYEITFRITPVKPAAWGGMNTWTPEGIWQTDGAGLEQDIVELDNSPSASNAAVHNWAANNTAFCIWGGCNGSFPTPANFDPNQYHTFGLRVTTNGQPSTDGSTMSTCAHIDNVFINCVSAPGGINSTEVAQRQFLIVQNACDHWNYNGGCNGNDGTLQHMYVKSVRVWSCANWQTTQCNGPVLTGAP
jgi:hypothetical protein